MDIPLTQADYERWIGQLYLEKCKWQRAAELLDAALEQANAPTPEPPAAPGEEAPA